MAATVNVTASPSQVFLPTGCNVSEVAGLTVTVALLLVTGMLHKPVTVQEYTPAFAAIEFEMTSVADVIPVTLASAMG